VISQRFIDCKLWKGRVNAIFKTCEKPLMACIAKWGDKNKIAYDLKIKNDISSAYHLCNELIMVIRLVFLLNGCCNAHTTNSCSLHSEVIAIEIDLACSLAPQCLLYIIVLTMNWKYNWKKRAAHTRRWRHINLCRVNSIGGKSWVCEFKYQVKRIFQRGVSKP
jgi:hypothetical protein